MHLPHLKDKLHRKSAEEQRTPEISTSSKALNSSPSHGLEDQGPPPYSAEPQGQTFGTTSTSAKDTVALPTYEKKDAQSEGKDNRPLDDLDREDQRIQELKAMDKGNKKAGLGPWLINGALAVVALGFGGGGS